MSEEHTAQQVSTVFVKQYYNTLLGNTHQLFKFYKEDSTALRAEYNETGNAIAGLKSIRAMFEAIDFKNVRIELQFVDAQRSLNGSIFVITNGTLSTNKSSREFIQGFVLAAQQPKGYYVLNDVFRYSTPQDGPDAKTPLPAVNFGTFGSHGRSSSDSSPIQMLAASDSSVLKSDGQLSEPDSTAATAGGSLSARDEIASRPALSEGFGGPKTISSNGSISGSVRSDSDGTVSEEEAKTPLINGHAESKQEEKPVSGQRRVRPVVSGKRGEQIQKRPLQKKDGKGKRTVQKYEEEIEPVHVERKKKEKQEKGVAIMKEEDEKEKEGATQEQREANHSIENPTSWAHAVVGLSYEPPAQPVIASKNEAKKERGNRRDREKEQGSRADRTSKGPENGKKTVDHKHQKREGSGRHQTSIHVGKLDPTTTDDELKEAFSQFGTITSLNNKAGKGSFAVMFFENHEAVEMALKANEKLTVKGVKPVIQKGRKPERIGNGERREFKGPKPTKEDGFKKVTGRDSKERNIDGGWSVQYRGRGGRPRGRGGRPSSGGGAAAAAAAPKNNGNTTATATDTTPSYSPAAATSSSNKKE